VSVRVRRVSAGEGPAVPLERLAELSGCPAGALRRLVELGLLDPVDPAATEPRFAPASAALVARALRLRRDLGLDYAGAILASELLARIEDLEDRLRRARGAPPG
jgi:hypothetical protein